MKEEMLTNRTHLVDLPGRNWFWLNKNLRGHQPNTKKNADGSLGEEKNEEKNDHPSNECEFFVISIA